MDPSVVQLPPDPIASADAPRSGELTPGRKRNEQGEPKDAAAAAALTVPFADILRSKRLDLETGTEEKNRKEHFLKTGQAARKEGEETHGKLSAGRVDTGAQLRRPAVEVQAKETLEYLKERAGQAMQAAQSKVQNREGADVLPGARPSDKGALSPSEEALLKEMVQKNGSMAAQKKAARMTGYVNGEPLNRREGIHAVKSMTAKEGEVLKILSGEEGAPAPSKAKAARQAKPQPGSAVRDDAAEGSGRVSRGALAPDKAMQEPAGPPDLSQDRPVQAGQGKRQAGAGWTNPEFRDAQAGPPALAALQGKGIDGAAPARPQAVISQVLDGAAQILRDGSGRMVLTLQPPRLGTLDLDVVVQDNRVKMVMLADNQEVKQMLQAGLDDLRNALRDRGFEIDRLEILVQNRPDDSGSDFWREAGFARGDSPKGEERRPGRDTDPEPRETPARPVRTGNGGLSVFA
jgi:flagellar hook-length control protein FliK